MLLIFVLSLLLLSSVEVFLDDLVFSFYEMSYFLMKGCGDVMRFCSWLLQVLLNVLIKNRRERRKASKEKVMILYFFLFKFGSVPSHR